ncbi:MAG: ATP-binding cassette domain-containing protein [Spirochaetia bacterium]
MAAAEDIITIQGLTKIFTTDHSRYNEDDIVSGDAKSLWMRSAEMVHALEDMSLHIRRRAIHALIGPAGAGKTTLLKILAGMLCPSQGSMVVDGFVPWEQNDHYQMHIGMFFAGKSQLAPNLPVADTFNSLKVLYGLTDKRFQKNLDYLLDGLDLKAAVLFPENTLTPCQRLKCELVCALIHMPRLVLLDEPFARCDKAGREQIAGFLKKLNREKKITFVITTENMAEIKDVCTTVSVVNFGRIVFHDALRKLKMYNSNTKMLEVIVTQSLAEAYAGRRAAAVAVGNR